MLVLLLLSACAGPGTISTEPTECEAGFVRADDGLCYEDDGGDTDPGGDTDTGPVDADSDGYAVADDCDDANDAVHPSAEEACDGLDNDCDELVDENGEVYWYLDADGDGVGVEGTMAYACAMPEGYAATSGDCDDTDPARFPGATDDTMDGVDQDCDGADFDPCREPYGAAEFVESRLTVSETGPLNLPITGNAVFCGLSCDVDWLVALGGRPDDCSSTEYVGPLPHTMDGTYNACVVPGVTDNGNTGTCTAHTSAGDLTVTIEWRTPR